MQENDPDNPFQSPLASEPRNFPPFPTEIFWGICGSLLLLCVVLLFKVPGLGILSLFLVVPGILRGFLMIQRERKQRAGAGHPAQLIFISLLMMGPVIFAAAIGFGITCYAAARVLEYFPGLSIHRDYSTIILAVFGPALGVATLTFGLLFWLSLMDRGVSLKAKPDDEPEAAEIP